MEVFHGEQLVVIITPSFISMRFLMDLWTLKWEQMSGALVVLLSLRISMLPIDLV